MNPVNDLIDSIVDSSRVPCQSRRHEIARELRAHIEDFIQVAQEAGHSDEEIRRLLLANFGDPREIAEEFAVVYRRERAIQRISVFLLATISATTLISAAALGVQACAALSFGVPFGRVFAVPHLKFETLYVFCTMTTYVSLLLLEKRFTTRPLAKAAGNLAPIFLLAGLALSTLNVPPEIFAAAFASGMLLRSIQVHLKSGTARIVAAASAFGLIGLAAACRQWSAAPNEAAVQLAVWLAIGLCGHFMTNLSRRVDRAFENVQ